MTLTEFLQTYRISIRAFSLETGLAWHTIRRAKQGLNITLQTAIIICHASQGRITLDELKIGDS